MRLIIDKILKIAQIKPKRADEYLFSNLVHGFHEIPDVLFHWGIHSLAVEIEEEDLNWAKSPALLELTNESGPDFALILWDGEHRQIYMEKAGHLGLQTEIPSTWTGRALVMRFPVRPIETHGYQTWKTKKKQQKILLVLAAGLALGAALAAFYSISAQPIHWVLLALNALGVALSAVLAKASHDTRFSERTCKTVSVGKGCAGVLNSSAAKINGWLSMGEAGLIYFASGFLFMLGALAASNGGEDALAWAAVSGLLAGLFPFYSFYQQWRIKSWCPLCLAVQGILLLSSALWLPFLEPLTAMPPFLYAWACFSLCVPLVGVLMWNPLLLSSAESMRDKWDLFKFRTDTVAIHALLAQNKSLDKLALPTDVVTGNPDARIEVMVVSSPICPACRMLHHQMKNIVEEFKEEVLFVSRLTPHGGSQGLTVLREILKDKSHGKAEEAVDFWFSASFAQTTALDKEPRPDLDYQALAAKDWMDAKGFSEVPLVFVNGKQLPAAYGIASLRFYLRDLIFENI
jgi:hypothetical protein